MTQSTQTAHIATANHLVSGEVIYLNRLGVWQRELAKAAVFRDEDTATMALSQATKRGRLAVGAYLAEVQPGPSGPVPVLTRERLRAQGPSSQAA